MARPPMRPILVAGLLAGAMTVNAPTAAQSFFKNQPPRLTVAAEAPGKPVAAGTASVLTLEVTPNPGIHVYAPGNPDYIPVAVDVTPVAAVKVDPATFPDGKTLLFGPTKAAVKVYSEPFEVRVPFTPGVALRKAYPGRKTVELTLKGTLSYQACDTRVCFPPQTAPFEVSITVRLSQP
jgi:Thiol:disulfide interchange protein DsbD, N-terminal